MPRKFSKKGFLIVHAIVFGAIAIIVISALVAWAGTNLKVARTSTIKEKAIQIAEAGIDYYRWHLAHAPADFTDGTNGAGPYVHDFFDKDGVLIGSFSLDITPPLIGSTIVTIVSTGKTIDDPDITRKIKTKLAIPSLAKFAFVSNGDMRFGQGTEVFGPIHSNGGIRFDGVAHNIVSSAKPTYNDLDSDDCNNNSSFGVHTCLSPADPTAPAAVPSRTDVFESGRQFPVADVDFVGLTNNLSQIKASAQAGGKYFASSGASGYKIVLRTDDKYEVYRVNTLQSPPNNCTNSQSQTGWGTWSIGTGGGALTQVSGSPFDLPDNRLIFVEDNVWVEGTINTARLTIASGKFPDNSATRTSITVNNDLKYTNFDGTDVISLIAQNNINVGLTSDNSLDIHAALVAQNGRIGRYYYGSNCGSNYVRNQITLYGMLASYGRYGFAYTDNTGYANRIINYDANLLYGPPPSFPLTSDQYTTISWEEI